MVEVLKPRKWTEAELRAAGYRYYPRKKQLVLAGRLPPSAAPMRITYPLGETVVAEAGDVICFEPGEQLHQHLSEYEHWSVKPDIFRTTYKKWDVANWKPNRTAADLVRRGCRPYYKWKGVWARRIDKPIHIQSLESPKPFLVPAGMWVAIGDRGEPWHIENDKFLARYIVENKTGRKARRSSAKK